MLRTIGLLLYLCLAKTVAARATIGVLYLFLTKTFLTDGAGSSINASTIASTVAAKKKLPNDIIRFIPEPWDYSS